MVTTFEVAAGTEITWQTIDDAPLLRAKDYRPMAKAGYARVRAVD